MQDTSILAALRPARLGLISMCDEISNAGWPEPAAWWIHSPGFFIKLARQELAALEAGGGEGDCLMRAGLLLLQAAHVRAQGRG